MNSNSSILLCLARDFGRGRSAKLGELFREGEEVGERLRSDEDKSADCNACTCSNEVEDEDEAGAADELAPAFFEVLVFAIAMRKDKTSRLMLSMLVKKMEP